MYECHFLDSVWVSFFFVTKLNAGIAEFIKGNLIQNQCLAGKYGNECGGNIRASLPHGQSRSSLLTVVRYQKICWNPTFSATWPDPSSISLMSSRLRAFWSATRMIIGRAPYVTSKSQSSDLVEGAHRGLSAVRFWSKHPVGCLSPRASGSLLWGHMQLRLSVPVFLQRSLLLVFCVALNSCQAHKANSAISIEFTDISPVAQGGRERVDKISGRVRKARPSSRLLFMRTAGNGGCSPGRHTSDRDGNQ